MANKYKITFILLLSFHLGVYAQVHISGTVRDRESGEVLIGANVYNPKNLAGTSTDNNGYFNMVLKDKTDSLYVTYVGYTMGKLGLQADHDTIMHIELTPGSNLAEVKVTAARKISFNQASLSNSQLTYIPTVGAQPDVLKTLQLLPGIQTQNEGSSNLLVRGGGPGQNLFLIDNVSLFYVNHLGGFVSVFNPEVLNDVRVLKGGFPAKYGGKLSSVVDLTMKEGNRAKHTGSAGIGVLGAHLTVEGPISDKATYLFSGRKTFTELLFGLITYMQDENYIASYGFYDLNGKISWHPTEKNSIQANFYAGDDKLSFTLFDINEKSGYKNRWGNILGSVHWKSILTSRSSINTTLSYTRYRVNDLRNLHLQDEFDTLDYSSSYYSSVRDLNLMSEWKQRINHAWAIDAGIQSSYLSFLPNEFWEGDVRPDRGNERITGLETSLYLENHISAGSWLNMNIGLRGVSYLTQGILNTGIEPRIDLTVLLPGSQMINSTYMRGSQYSNLVFTSGNFLNNEVWVPMQAGMKPSLVDQYSFGWKGQFLQNMFTAEVNVYHKKMQNLASFREGYSNLKGDAHWESKLEYGGSGKSYGAELFISKDKGKYTGFLSYAYSRTTRQFDNINKGEPYVYEYDRPHSLTFDLHRKISDRFVLNVLWVYQSGLPFTPAIARTYVPMTLRDDPDYQYEALVYGERNSARMRSYHRLDVGLHFKTKTIKGRDETWAFTIYNLYNRQNPYFYYYSERPGLGHHPKYLDEYNSLKLFQFSFFPLIPSVSYKVEF